MSTERTDFKVLIIGAGMSGICTAIQLERLGIDFAILEREQGLGGTWFNNTYPGSGCDVPSRLYSFSFARNPEWTRVYSRQPEILRYFEELARQHGITERIRHGSEVRSAHFDERAGGWSVECGDGSHHTGNVLVSACGQLNRPYTPDFPGMAEFSGVSFHSAEWDHGADLAGKRIVAIGAGASAIQYLPEIAPDAGALTIFQRSPNWIIPKPDGEIGALKKWMYRYLPLFDTFERYLTYWLLEKNFPAFHKIGGFNRYFASQAQKHLEDSIEDPGLRGKLLPDYPIGCKRILISDDYYPMLLRDNVSLVTEAVERITSEGVIAADGALHPADVIIYGTGFQTTNFLSHLDIRGLDGLTLAEAWADGPDAHRGVQVSGFPNFFMLYGPNTNLGHNSIIFMVEQQVRYLMQCVRTLHRRPGSYLDVRPEAQQSFVESLRERMDGTVWQGSCQSWYKTADGHVTNNWPSSTLSFWWQLRKLRLHEMDLHPPQPG